ncbi:MAG: universal stress protein [Polyangiaceae bacterium]
MTMQRHVLAAVDLDVTTSLVLETAIRETLARPGADLLVLYVLPVLTKDPLSAREPGHPDTKLVEVQRCVETALADFGAANPGVALPRTEVELAVDRPAHGIVWAAAHFDAELVVVGSHGNRKGLARLLMGSTSQKVVRLAGCPVIVVRPKEHDPRLAPIEIEPLCPNCATTRFATKGETLWCARHAEHHVFGHDWAPGGGSSSGPDAPPAWSSSTGT